MKLIPEWRSAWRLFSVQAAALLTIVSLIQTQVLPHFELVVPAEWWPWVTACFGAAIAILRILSQNLPGGEPPTEEPSHD